MENKNEAAVKAELKTLTDAELEARMTASYAAEEENRKTYNKDIDAATNYGKAPDTAYWRRYREISSARYPIYCEQRRRQTNATRARNAEKNAALSTAGQFAVGQKVEVHAFGRWYAGEVIELGTRRVTVRYTTTTTHRTFEKKVNLQKIRSITTNP